MPDTIFDLVGEWFDDETSSTRRADLLSQIRDRWIARGPFLAMVHQVHTIRAGADVGKVGWVDVGDLSTGGWPVKPLFRGCIPGNEAGVSWTFEREVAAEYARVRGGRVITLEAWHHLPILGAIVSRVPAGGVTEELLVGAVGDGWVES